MEDWRGREHVNIVMYAYNNVDKKYNVDKL